MAVFFQFFQLLISPLIYRVEKQNLYFLYSYDCKGTEVGDAGFSLCGGLAKTTKSLSAFLSWFICSLLVDG